MFSQTSPKMDQEEDLACSGLSLTDNNYSSCVANNCNDVIHASSIPCDTISSEPDSEVTKTMSECPSVILVRDTMISQLSMASSDLNNGERSATPEYSLSRDSTFAFLRERSTMSTGSGSSQDREEYFSARESLDSSSSHGSRQSGSVEMTNQLVSGPLVTLPSNQQLASATSPLPPPEEPSATEEVSSHQTLPHSVHTTEALKNKEKESISSSTGVAVSSQPTAGHVQESGAAQVKARVKKTPNDFIFGRVIGEGSYSTVYLAKEVVSQKEFAIKVCDKKHLIREKKTHIVMREKEVLMKLDHPFFIKLAYTFQDPERLYYVLTYARNGELLGYLHKLSAFDVPCTRFYTAEIVLALEYLHSLSIIHRDLKPENILLSDDMHIKITDFGTSKILSQEAPSDVKRKNSFVGTAEYVSPEVLNNQPANFGSDLWGLGCIIYQCLSGSLPFRSGNDYQTFQKIIKVEYDFPDGFHPQARDLVQKLLVLEPSERLGMQNMKDIKQHPFYEDIDWVNLPESVPPKLMPYLPANADNPEFWGQDHRTGFDDQRLAEIITGQGIDGMQSLELEEVMSLCGDLEEKTKKKEKLTKQKETNPFHQFVENNLILRQGYVDKRKGLFARKRMLLLTEGPHLYYVDAHNKVLKGEIPWSKDLRPEAKKLQIFFVHTPHRTYYLESRLPDAHLWVKKIQEVWKTHYGENVKVNS